MCDSVCVFVCVVREFKQIEPLYRELVCLDRQFKDERAFLDVAQVSVREGAA